MPKILVSALLTAKCDWLLVADKKESLQSSRRIVSKKFKIGLVSFAEHGILLKERLP